MTYKTTTPLDIYKRAENKGYHISAFGLQDDKHGFEWVRVENKFYVNGEEINAQAFEEFKKSCEELTKEIPDDR